MQRRVSAPVAPQSCGPGPVRGLGLLLLGQPVITAIVAHTGQAIVTGLWLSYSIFHATSLLLSAQKLIVNSRETPAM